MFSTFVKHLSMLFSLIGLKGKKGKNKNTPEENRPKPILPALPKHSVRFSTEEEFRIVGILQRITGISLGANPIESINFSAAILGLLNYIVGIKERDIFPKYALAAIEEIGKENGRVLSEIYKKCCNYVTPYLFFIEDRNIDKLDEDHCINHFRINTGRALEFEYDHFYGNLSKFTIVNNAPGTRTPYDGGYTFFVSIPSISHSGESGAPSSNSMINVKELPIIFNPNDEVMSFKMKAFTRYYDKFDNKEQSDIAAVIRLRMKEAGGLYTYTFVGGIDTVPFLIKRTPFSEEDFFGTDWSELRDDAVMNDLDLTRCRINFDKTNESFEEPYFEVDFKL